MGWETMAPLKLRPLHKNVLFAIENHFSSSCMGCYFPIQGLYLLRHTNGHMRMKMTAPSVKIINKHNVLAMY